MTDWIQVTVARRRVEADGIISLELTPANGGELPPFEAGAHIDVQVPGGIVRQYSLCNVPGERSRYVLGVLREAASRGGSQALHERVAEGDALSISAPRNHFPMAPAAEYSLLLAGGIGITPILAMAEELSATGREFELHYCTRSAERTAFLARLRSASYVARVHFHYDDGPDEQKLMLAHLFATHSLSAHLYVCGPRGFMDWVISEARAQGWAEERIHREYFSNDVAPHPEDGSFEVVLAKSGRSVRVGAEQTVIAALAAAGVEVPISCEQGVCGTCLTRVLEGVPDHRDLYLTPEEQARNDQFTPCCSRSKSARLVLDL